MMTDKPIISKCANCGTTIQLCSGSGCKEAADYIAQLEAKIDSFGTKHPADPDFYKQYIHVRWSDHHVNGQYLEVETVDGWKEVYPLIEKIAPSEQRQPADD